mgnify:CR=1 FL=1
MSKNTPLLQLPIGEQSFASLDDLIEDLVSDLEPSMMTSEVLNTLFRSYRKRGIPTKVLQLHLMQYATQMCELDVYREHH